MEQNKLSAKKASLLLDKLRTSVETSSKANFDLCWLLFECSNSIVYVGDDPVFVYERWGYETWHKFVEVEVGVHEHTANVYCKIGKVFGHDLSKFWDPEDLLPITKMAILASWDGLNSKNVKSKMRWAVGKTCCQMQHELLGKHHSVVMSFSVRSDEQRSINEAIEIARSELDYGKKMTRGEIMSIMVQQWADTASRKRPNRPNRLKLVKG